MQSYVRDVLRFRAAKDPGRVAIRDWDAGVDYTWRELEGRSRNMARFFSHRLGAEKGDVVGFLCGNTPLLVEAYFASCTTGVVLDPFNQRLIAPELSAMAERERPVAMLFEAAYRDKARAMSEATGGRCALVCIDQAPAEGELGLADIEACASLDPVKPADIDEDDPQMLIHTGGTTGLPKAGILTYRGIFMNAVAEILSWQLSRDDWTYAAMPLYHTGGWNVGLVPLLYAGGTVTITKGFRSDVFLKLVGRGELTFFMGADPMFRCAAADPAFESTDFSRVRFLCCGGGPLSQASSEAFLSRGVKLFPGYGMTEHGPNVASSFENCSLDHVAEKPFALRRPLMFTEARVVRADGTEAAPGEVGELYLRGPLAFGGYLGNAQATAELHDGEWTRTGDMACCDADGDITLCDRKKNLYISGGENVFPAEVERVLEACPDVAEACVLGVPDDRWGEVGKAVVVLSPGGSLDAAREWAKARLSTIKQPHWWAETESIPKNSAGKRSAPEIRRRWGAPADGESA